MYKLNAAFICYLHLLWKCWFLVVINCFVLCAAFYCYDTCRILKTGQNHLFTWFYFHVCKLAKINMLRPDQFFVLNICNISFTGPYFIDNKMSHKRESPTKLLGPCSLNSVIVSCSSSLSLYPDNNSLKNWNLWKFSQHWFYLSVMQNWMELKWQMLIRRTWSAGATVHKKQGHVRKTNRLYFDCYIIYNM